MAPCSVGCLARGAVIATAPFTGDTLDRARGPLNGLLNGQRRAHRSWLDRRGVAAASQLEQHSAPPAATASPLTAAAAECDGGPSVENGALNTMPPSGAAGVSTAPADDVPLGAADLERFMRQHGIAGAIVPPLNGSPPPPGCCEVKSLVFLVDSHPLVLVLPLAARVDEKRLAALLHTGRNRVGLAPVGALVQLCGYTVGNVPPFGHRSRLPVIVDTAVAAYQSCYAGGGSDDAEVLVPVSELLRAAAATVADITTIATSSTSTSVATHDSSTGGSKLAQERTAAAAALLPQPWQAGQVEVTLEGIISQRRKIARLLMFANLVPLDAAAESIKGTATSAGFAPSKPGTVSLMRRLWRHPETQEACEVQLILGATLERRLGSDAAAELLRSVRAGQAVRLSGYVQQHIQKAGDTSVMTRGVLDVVVAHIQLIDKPATATATPAALSDAEAAAAPVEEEENRGEEASPAGASPAALVNGSSTGGKPAKAASGCYQLPAAVEHRVVLVDSEAGLAQLEAALFADSSNSSATDNADAPAAAGSRTAAGDGSGTAPGFAISNDSSSSSMVGSVEVSYRLVVGLDCEWQPYERDEPKTPVSLLQLATPDEVFLLDMLALCAGDASGNTGEWSEVAVQQQAGGLARPVIEEVLQQQLPGTEDEAPAEQEQQQQQQQGSGRALLPPLQQRLSDALAGLFADASIIKVGFGLSHDLQRLAESYPWLPCFGTEGPVPLRSHVDVQLMARTALAPRLSHGRRRTSLTSLADLVLGRPLDKTEQCSSWGSRPLTASQVRYAAADAHALVAMYAALQPKRRGLESPFWLSKFTGGLTDVAAFHPSKRSAGRTRRAVAPSSPDAGGPTNGSTALLGRTRLLRQSVAGEAPEKRVGQTHLLDVNVGYLLNTYLGRQLPQGGKAAVVRASAAHSGRPESGRTPSFPRGCGGLLEWRNAFILFVSLPEPGASQAGRSYPNDFLWLPPEAGFAPASVKAGGEGAAVLPTAAAASSDSQLSAAAGAEGFSEELSAALATGRSVAESLRRQQAGCRLCMTWWPSRGQTLAHPQLQRLLAAGAASTAGAVQAGQDGLAAAAREAVQAPENEPARLADCLTAGPEAADVPSMAGPVQTSVLLFCRSGSAPYVFCGRVLPAAVEEDDDGSRSCCVTWQLADCEALLGSATFLQLLGIS